MYIFKKVPDENDRLDSTIVQHETEDVTLDGLVDTFIDFLRGCSFAVNSEDLKVEIKERMETRQRAEQSE